ncbi:MAG: hypothetical protein LBR80_06145 [Deltaproteobacteria bacterium]|jgi:hypothetical protein|nr:hypothetical protein [Deltaproteobacteria bacterium]
MYKLLKCIAGSLVDGLFLLAIAISILILSYNHTYVDLTPDFSGIKFKEIRFGSFSFDLPDFFTLNPVYNRFNFSIVYPGNTVDLSERRNAEIKSKNTPESEDTRCEPNFNKLLPPYQEDDHELSLLSQHKAVMFWPQGEYEQTAGDYAVAFFLDDGCVFLQSGHLDGENHAERKIIFREKVKDFLKYYTFQPNETISETGFRTLFGNIRHNNAFKILGYFSFTSDIDRPLRSKVRFTLKYSDDSEFYPFMHLAHLSRVDRLIHYTQTRLKDRSIMDYRWTIKKGDFQFSPLFSGKEFIDYMPISKKGYSENFKMWGYAKRKSDTIGFSDYIIMKMEILGDAQMINKDINTIYGYWVRAKESARIM